MFYTQQIPKLAFALTSFGLVVACSGGGGGQGGATQTFGQQNSEAQSLTSAFLDGNGQQLSSAIIAPDDSLSGQGTGTYDGFITGESDGNAFVATLELGVDLDALSLDGTASDFTLEDETTLTGTINGSGGINDASTVLPQVTLTLTGTLADSGTDLPTQLALDGNFYQSGSDAVGAIAGTVEGEIGNNPVLNGLFASER
ncbi:MAG: hypothetical protein AAFQ64_11210 [Pseudomonadota bacterium]